MGLLGRLIGTALDVLTTPIAIAMDVIPGCGGYVDGNRCKTGEKLQEIGDDLREEIEDL